MNVLQILPELNVGGVEIGTIELSRHLVKLGHKAVVVSHGGELVKDLEASGVRHYQLPVHKKSAFTIFKMVPRLVDIIKKEEIDIVHARSRVPAWIAYFASRKTNRIFITTCHGHYTKHPFSYVMGWAKRVIVLSNVIGQHMIDNFATPHERIRLVPRSVDLEKFKYTSPDLKVRDEFNVGIIARITPLKGHLHFIKAMAKVAKAVPRFKIWIVGDAPLSRQAYKEQLEILVRRLGLWNSTEFLGFQKDIPEILSHLDLLVLATTTHEAFGRVIVEAQGSGVPVVATRVGGVIDVIENGKTGLLVPPADPSSMAEAIIKIFKDKKLRQELAENAYKNVKEKYSLELMVKNTLDVYRDALENFKILIIKFSSLGDVILSTAAIRAIREKFRNNYRISCLVGVDAKDILLTCPYLDEVLVCDLKNRDKGAIGLFKLGTVLRKKGFDIVVDLQNNRKSHLLAWLSLVPRRLGYSNKKFGFLLNEGIKDEKPTLDPVAHQFEVLKMLDIELKNSYLELWPTAKDQLYVDELLDSHWISANQRICGINISASERWATKNWPLSSMAKLCESLGGRDIRIVITGTENDSALANRLMSMVKAVKLINACGKTTVNQLGCLIRRCSFYISSDSAPLHVAAAVATPFIALFGPTDYKRHLPPAKQFAVIKKDLSCAPCYKPKCKSVKCMELITPQEVLEAIDKILK